MLNGDAARDGGGWVEVWRAVQEAGEAQDQVHGSLNGRGGSHLELWPNCRGTLQAIDSKHAVLAWIEVVSVMRVSMLGLC